MDSIANELIWALIAGVLGIIYFFIGTQIKKYWYIYKGKKLRSMLYHGLALCYEQLEYDTESGEKPSIHSIAQWQIDKNGKGFLKTEYYELKSNSSSNVEMSIQGVVIEPVHQEYGKILMETLKNEDSDFMYSLTNSYNGKQILIISHEICVDPTENDARYYITGQYESIMIPKKNEILRAYNKYKVEHPYSIQ